MSYYNKIKLPQNYKNPKTSATTKVQHGKKSVGKGPKGKSRSLTKKVDYPEYGPLHIHEVEGYVKVGTQYLHQIVWKAYHGIIPNGWEVHHIDINRKNNNIENLVALPREFHQKIHKSKGKMPKRPQLMRIYYEFFDEYLVLQRSRDELVKQLKVIDDKLHKVGANTNFASPRTSDEHIENMKQVNRGKVSLYYGLGSPVHFPKQKRAESLVAKPVVPEEVSNIRDLGYDPEENVVEVPLRYNLAPIDLSEEAEFEMVRIRRLIEEVRTLKPFSGEHV